jgi:23S rRNA (uracil1939-C5)-methyltransferase
LARAQQENRHWGTSDWKSGVLVMPRGLRYGDTLDVRVERLGPKGVGLASVEARVGPDGAACTYALHIRKAFPGERVRIMVEAGRRRKLPARVLEVIEPSPDRIEPRCPHYGWREVPGKGCGGCTLQALDYPRQLEIKHGLIKEILGRAGVAEELIAAPIGAQDPWYYRNKMEFSFGDDRERKFALGLYPTGWRNEIVSLTACWLQSSFSADLVCAVREWCAERKFEPHDSRTGLGFLRGLVIREGKNTGDRLVELLTTADETPMCDDAPTPAADVARMVGAFVSDFFRTAGQPLTSFYWTQVCAVRGQPTRLVEHLLEGQPTFWEELRLPEGRSLRFQIHPRSFFQPNTLQAEELCATVLRSAQRIVSSLQEARVMDLYCGAGNLGLALAPYVGEVVGIELVEDAVLNARDNARENGIANARFIAGDVGAVLATPEMKALVSDIELVVVDPPRAGLLPGAQKEIVAINAPALVYVSCNPTALARDLVVLGEVWYSLVEVQPVDLFPHTHHIENVAAFVRTPS